MKKIILFLFLILISAPVVSAAEVIDNTKAAEIQRHISDVGFNILNSNGIETRATFYYNTDKNVNASTSTRTRTISMYRGLYNMLKSDDEIAAVLSHEISHSVDSYQGVFRGAFHSWAYGFSPKKYEYKADKRAVDYMVKAGYHPVVYIIMLNKTGPQMRYDWASTHPLTSRRMMEVYEYIYKKYPEYLVNNPHKNDVYYQNFLLTSKQNRKELQRKIETKSKSSAHYL